MLQFPKWKVIGILATVLLAIIIALPNALPKPAQDKFREYGLRPLTLGLDLQGGINILLEIDRNDLKSRTTEQTMGDIRATLREAKIAYAGLNKTPDGISVRISKPEDVEKAASELRLHYQPIMDARTGQVSSSRSTKDCPNSAGRDNAPEADCVVLFLYLFVDAAFGGQMGDAAPPVGGVGPGFDQVLPLQIHARR